MSGSVGVGNVSEAYLALGANLGDRLANLRHACDLLQQASVTVLARSRVFETEAVADEAQPPYLNAALRVQTAFSPEPLLQLALEIERRMGRVRPREGRWAPRLIDIDILLYGSLVQTTAQLILPHPRLLERPFVRIPLADVAVEGLLHPLTGERLDRAAEAAAIHELPFPL